MSFPTTIDDVTTEWLSDIMHIRINEFKSKRIGQMTGYMSEVFRVSWKNSEMNAVSSVVIKFPNAAGLSSSVDLYKTETGFYSSLAESKQPSSINHPTCYHVQTGNDKKFVLVLEDCNEPYSVGNLKKGITMEELKLAIEQIAQFHAYWWHKKDQNTKMDRFLADSSLKSWLPLIKICWHKAKQSFERDGVLDPSIDTLVQFIIKYANRISVPALTLVHGDYRPDNMMIWRSHKPNERKVVVLDFQSLHWGHPMQDLTYLISSGVDASVRAKQDYELVKFYHDCLLSHGVADYSIENCWQDYMEYLIYTLLLPIVFAAGDQESSDMNEFQQNTKEMAKIWRDRAIASVKENNCVGIIDELAAKLDEIHVESELSPLDSNLVPFVSYYAKTVINWTTYTPDDNRKRIQQMIDAYNTMLPATEEGIKSIIDYPATDAHPEFRVFTPSKPSGKIAVIIPNAWVCESPHIFEKVHRDICINSNAHIVVIKHSETIQCRDIIKECCKAIQYVLECPDSLQLPTTSSISLIGDQKGGHTAVCVTKELVDQGKTTCVDNLILVCPWLDPTCSETTYESVGDRYGSLLSAEGMKWCWGHYLTPREDNLADFHPLQMDRKALRRFPKTSIITADLDITKPENDKFLAMLQENDVETSLKEFQNVISIFFNGLFPKGQEAFQFIGTTINNE